eukprot:gnl/TRDRNA2_/TRDRNA2_44217_c0_seq2.p1 gnl/TRDRNA2_/TRDRNA2_44217_c0~~gnl/TRDRNA2_/TRDRNA2_44217_c0_seq2.p1  ORF type:complete len:553 (+),score=70.66 gnl/TRDRNA2_/TRDRNA2_44217_c0_seq2:47-1705(+)
MRRITAALGGAHSMRALFSRCLDMPAATEIRARARWLARTAPGGLVLWVVYRPFPLVARAEETEGAGLVADGLPMRQRGDRVFVWGQRAALPVCEASGDAAPEGDVREPMEVCWFRKHAERHRCKWRQLAFGPSFGAARTDAGELFLWGSSRGKDGARRWVEPTDLKFEDGDPSLRFRDVQCSESAIWALTVDGDVVVWERVPELLEENRLGRRPSSSSRSQAADTVRGGKRLGSLDQPVRMMSVGASHAAFVTEDGEVFCLGSNRSGECGADPSICPTTSSCRQIRFPRGVTPIVMVRCGRDHTVAISSEGSSWAWGDDSKIQLGLGDTRSNYGDERPRSGSRGYHNWLGGGEAMVTPSGLRGIAGVPMGQVPGSGSAKYGEFDPHVQWKPAPMTYIPLEFERQVHGTPYPPANAMECGDDFTVLRVRDSPDWFSPEEESNRIFCCGENTRGQCGRSQQSTQQTFAAARLPRNSNTEGFSCGSAHCLSVLRRIGTEKREVWAWGANDHGQAAGGKKRCVCPTDRVKMPLEYQVKACWCGFSNSSLICTSAS